jgi:hypothetical protein
MLKPELLSYNKYSNRPIIAVSPMNSPRPKAAGCNKCEDASKNSLDTVLRSSRTSEFVTQEFLQKRRKENTSRFDKKLKQIVCIHEKLNNQYERSWT